MNDCRHTRLPGKCCLGSVVGQFECAGFLAARRKAQIAQVQQMNVPGVVPSSAIRRPARPQQPHFEVASGSAASFKARVTLRSKAWRRRG